MNFWSSEFVAGSHVPNIKGRKLLSLTICKQFRTLVLRMYLFACCAFGW